MLTNGSTAMDRSLTPALLSGSAAGDLTGCDTGACLGAQYFPMMK
jgi:hypothetical protein